jgi:hypothetical protein
MAIFKRPDTELYASDHLALMERGMSWRPSS